MQKISVEKVEQKDDVAGAAASVRAEFDSRFRVRSRDMNVRNNVLVKKDVI